MFPTRSSKLSAEVTDCPGPATKRIHACFGYSAQSSEPNLEQQFVAGGQIDLNLSAGGYVIRGTPDNRISIELNPSQAPHVRAGIKIEGNGARIDVNGPEHNFQATIYVPQRTDLVISQSVGDLRIQAVEGNKDIDLNVGSLKVDVPKAADYGEVDATVRIGSLSLPHGTRSAMVFSAHCRHTGRESTV